MSAHYNNSFLPSGAINVQPCSFSHYLATPSNALAITTTPQSSVQYTPSVFQPHSVMSPPKTRCGSAEDINAILTDDWCSFVQQLQSKFQGERTYLRADRDRMQEVIEEERELWERERKLWNTERKALRSRIFDLETELSSVSNSVINVNHVPSSQIRKSTFGLKGADESVSTKIPQESGRNADGSPFYAPAPQNPTRTFDLDIASNLRVDDLVAPQETAIRVTSKELKSSDFAQQITPPTTDILHDIIPEAIDISYIQPELDSVAIRVSAISPTFAAKVLSPQSSSSSSGSLADITLDLSNETNTQREGRVESQTCGPAKFAQPENRRLTLFAGHTPNHSVSKFDLLESESVTPAQTYSSHTSNLSNSKLVNSENIHLETIKIGDGPCAEEIDDGDRDRLSEPLGLVNISGPDEIFLAQLTEKLTIEARKNDNIVSPTSSESCRLDQLDTPQLSNTHLEEEGPFLRMKPSMNFGRPFGSI